MISVSASCAGSTCATALGRFSNDSTRTCTRQCTSVDSRAATCTSSTPSRPRAPFAVGHTSTGKALLATPADTQLKQMYEQEQLTQLTANSIGSRTQLFAALDDIRRRGYALSQE